MGCTNWDIMASLKREAGSHFLSSKKREGDFLVCSELAIEDILVSLSALVQPHQCHIYYDILVFYLLQF